MTSPTGASVIAVSCHTVDGRGTHAAPGRNAAKQAMFKARCATNIIDQVARQRAQSRAALASSQGQSREPSIIIAGDLNTPRSVFLEEMGNLDIDEDIDMTARCTGNLYVITDREARHCEGLPLIMGPDNRHEAAFMEVSLDEQVAFTAPLPSGWEHVEHDVQEQAAKARQSSSRCKDDPAMAIVAINDGNDCHQ